GVGAGGGRALCGGRVFAVEQIGEVASRLDAHADVDRLFVVVDDRDRLEEAVADRALTDHRHLRVDVHGSGPGHEEEARFEVLKVVGRQRVQPLPVDGQYPAREEAGVVGEETGGV